MKIWPAGLAMICIWSLAGCAAKHPQVAGVYQYKRVGTQELLEPPGSTLPSAKNEILLHLGKARLGKIRGAACEVNAGSFQLRWNGKAADLRVITAHMVDGGDAARVPLSLLDDIDKFRAGLVALEANGCIRSGAAGPLLSRMMESLALPSRFAYFLRYGAAANLGYMDVEPPFRLKVMVPILKEGAAPNSGPSNVVGYETAWYVVAAKGRRFVPEAVEFYVKGQLQRSRKPSRAVVQLPDSLRYYRLFLLTRRSVSDHDILLLGSATKDGLELGTVAIKKDGHAACANLTCAQVPMDSFSFRRASRQGARPVCLRASHRHGERRTSHGRRPASGRCREGPPDHAPVRQVASPHPIRGWKTGYTQPRTDWRRRTDMALKRRDFFKKATMAAGIPMMQAAAQVGTRPAIKITDIKTHIVGAEAATTASSR